MADDLEIFEINPEADEAALKAKFKELTDRELFPAQDESILISLINYQSSVNQVKYAASLKNLFVRYARGIWLDLIGEFWECPRLKATPAQDMLQVKLFDVFESDKILPKDSEIETKDGLYVFKTKSDLIIPAGQLYGSVEIESEQAGAALNDYAAGDINSLVKNYEYIENVTNTIGASGGSDPEKDEDYIERLLIAPEKLSTAGTEDGYKYYAMSAHKDITDVSVDCPQEPATVTIGENVYTEVNGLFDDENVSGTVDYKTGIMELTFSEPVTSLKIRIQPAATVDIRVLTEDGEAAAGILAAVSDKLSPEKTRPLTDNVMIYSAQEKLFTVDADIEIFNTADYELVLKAVTEALEEYFSIIRKKFETDVLLSDINKVIKSVPGVYDVQIKSPLVSLIGDKKSFYRGSIGQLKITRSVKNGVFAA